MKRFSETTKWDDPWFRGLKPPEKLLFLFLVDSCNNAGFYEIDMPSMVFKTGMTEGAIQGACKGLARGIKGASEWLWIRNFLRHQKNYPLNPENPAHKQIIELCKDQSERFLECPEFKEFARGFKGASKGLASPIGIGNGKGTGKERGVQRGKPESEQEVIDYLLSLSLPKSDGEYFWNHWEGNGWQNGGKSIQDWKATVRSWKAAGHCPSQKPATASNGQKPWQSAAERKQAETDAANRRYREQKAAGQIIPEREPDGFRAWLSEKYPNATKVPYADMPGDIVEEWAGATGLRKCRGGSNRSNRTVEET